MFVGMSVWNFGIWDLDFWSFDFGILGFGIWDDLDFGILDLTLRVGHQWLHIRNVSDPQLQILHFDPLFSNKLQIGIL